VDIDAVLQLHPRVARQTVDLLLQGSAGHAITDGDGLARVEIRNAVANLGPQGDLLVQAHYSGIAAFAPAGVDAGTADSRALAVEPGSVEITMLAVSGEAGVEVILRATVSPAVPGKSVEFLVNGTSAGSGITDANGEATLSYTTETEGDYTIDARFAGDPLCASASGQGALHVSEAGTGPIGWWTLDDISGTTAADSSGNNNDGAIGPSVILGTAAPNGTAFSFDGFSTSYVQVPYGTGTLAPATTQITVSAWINPSSFDCAGSHPGQCAVVSNEGVPGDGTYGYGLRVIDFGTRLQWCWGSEGGGDCAYGNYPFQPDTWTNIVGTYDGAVLRGYVNGVLVGENATAFPALNTLRDLFIGRLPSGNLLWRGGIDDVRVYNRVVTPAELQQLAHLTP
jgi:hypothetical protein